MPEFKSASLQLRHEVGMQWLRFYAEHEARATATSSFHCLSMKVRCHADTHRARSLRGAHMITFVNDTHV